MTHEFGGPWTERKLDCLRAYIKQWLLVMSKQHWCTRYYVDAFSGTGERHQRAEAGQEDMLPIEDVRDVSRFFEGSARIALGYEPGFNTHILIEQNARRFDALRRLGDDYRGKAIEFMNEDANTAVRNLCTRLHKSSNARTIMFLDPYGCQVDWCTVEAIARTEAVDLWYLFPTGGVLRMLPHDPSRLQPAWANRLTALLGTDEWKVKFYAQERQASLFGDVSGFERKATADSVERFVLDRLKTTFPSVAKSCMRLVNHQGFPNFSLCFAAAARPEKGGGIALNIAEHLIGKGRGTLTRN